MKENRWKAIWSNRSADLDILHSNRKEQVF